MLTNKDFEWLFRSGKNMLKGGEGTIPSSGLFFQKSFKGLSEDTLGVSRPTVFPPTVTRLFFSVLFHLMIPTAQTRFDNHGFTSVDWIIWVCWVS
jgi:hypothetical protein